VVADSGRHFEVKNFSNYGKANVDTVINGLEKELGRILSDPRLAGNAQSMINEGLNKIHFVFRGSASVGGDLAAARSMLEAMRNKGNSVLGTISDDVIASRVRSHFNKQIDNALEALSTGKAIPDLGELVVF